MCACVCSWVDGCLLVKGNEADLDGGVIHLWLSTLSFIVQGRCSADAVQLQLQRRAVRAELLSYLYRT